MYRNTILMEMVPPEAKGERWKVTYAWQNQGKTLPDSEIDPKSLRSGKVEVAVPFESGTTPGIRGTLRFVISAWNTDAVMEE